MARDIYDAMETARCEAVGARTMPGTAGNIDAKIGHEADRKGYAQITRAADAPLSVAAGYLVRHLATGRPLPKGAANVMELWRAVHRGAGRRHAGAVSTTLLADQQGFARLARQVIADLGYGDQLGEDPDAADDEHEDEAEGEEQEENPDSQGEEEDSDRRRGQPRAEPGRHRGPSPGPGRRWTTWPIRRWATRPSCPTARRRWSRRRPPRRPRPIRTMRSSPPTSTKRSRPRIWPNRPNWNGCAPISTSSSSR